jgi:adenylate kinase
MLIGIQGSGKGTQARKILDKYNDYILFEMGGELRKFILGDSPEAKEAKELMDQGLKAPTSAIIKMAENFIAKNPGKNIILDGVIRSKDQNDALA